MGLYQGAEMIAGAGTTPSISIDDNTKHWIINGTDTGIVAEGKTPTLGLNASGYITVNGTATTIKVVSDYNNLSNRPIVSGKVSSYQSNTNSSQIRNITVSTSAPSPSDGVNGDIWVVYE